MAEELPHVRGQRQRPRVPGCDGAGTAERSYPAPRSGAAGRRQPTSEVRALAERSYHASEVRGGGREERLCVGGEGPLGEATSRPRPGVVTLRSRPEPEARAGGQEEHPEERWLRRPRRA